MKFQLFTALFIFIGFSNISYSSENSCLNKSEEETLVKNSSAKFFSLYQLNTNSFFLEIKNAVKSSPQRFYFSQKKRNFKCPDVIQITSPIKKYAGVSTTHVAAFDILEETSKLVGFSNSKFVHSKKFKNRFKKGEIVELNFPVNKEKLVSSNAKFIFSYATQNPSVDGLDKLSLLGIQPIFISEFQEFDVLARAEWIKVIGLFFGKYDQAKSHFSSVRSRYLSYKNKIKNVRPRPSVIMGKLQGSHWVAPAKNSYFATLMKDAGASYVFSDWKNENQVSISFERIIGRKKAINYWLPHSLWKSRKDILLEDKRYSYLAFFNKGFIFNNSKRLNRVNGNDFWESAVMAPDLLLKDLINIFHTSKSSHTSDQLRWYEKL